MQFIKFRYKFSYEEEDTCMSYEEEDRCSSQSSDTSSHYSDYSVYSCSSLEAARNLGTTEVLQW